jgi:hypothetical protein
MARPSQLFHTVVVIGASLGCGSAAAVHTAGGAGGADGNGGAPADAGPRGPKTPFDCAATEDFTCPSDGGACTCNANAPLSICDCARPGEFKCTGCIVGSPISGRCPNNDGVGCYCDTTVAIAAPTDCAHTEQFTCTWLPDYLTFTNCTCDTTAPYLDSMCTCTNCSLACQTAYSCPCPPNAGLCGFMQHESPRFACACQPPPVPIH